MSNIQREQLRNQIDALRQLADVVQGNRRTINFAKQRSFLTQTIQEVSR